MGAGPIGLAVVLWARQYAVGDIMVSDPVGSRRLLAIRLGATAVVDPTAESLTEACARELGGSAEVVIECVGRPGVLQAAVEVIAPYGRLVLVGLHFESETMALFQLLSKDITIKCRYDQMSQLYCQAGLQAHLAPARTGTARSAAADHAQLEPRRTPRHRACCANAQRVRQGAHLAVAELAHIARRRGNTQP